MSVVRQEHTVGDLHVETAGTGRPLLLIHGNSEDLHYFDHNVPTFAQARYVVAMDCRGQGRSQRGSGPLTLDRMAEDAAEVIRSISLPDEAGRVPFDVLGFSDGANVAMLVAIRHPEMVHRLVLNSGNIAVDGMVRRLRWKLRLLDRCLRIKNRRLARITREHELLRLMLDPPGISPDELTRLHMPTLVIAGSRDVIRRAHTRMIAALIPGAQLRIVRRGTHSVLRDRPQISTMIVETFLETGRAPSAFVPE